MKTRLKSSKLPAGLADDLEVLKVLHHKEHPYDMSELPVEAGAKTLAGDQFEPDQVSLIFFIT